MRVARIAVSLLFALVLVAFPGHSARAAAGDLDPSFGVDGKVYTIEIGSHVLDAAADMAINANGKIVAVGTAESGSGGNWHFSVVQYNADGSVDDGFGNHGGVFTKIGGHAFGRAVAVQADGKIVAGGDAPCGFAECFTLVRYNANGTIDGSFGQSGIVRTRFGACGCEIDDLAIQGDGKIVAVGWRAKGDDGNDDEFFAVARYNTDGSRDLSFGKFGKVSLSFGYGLDVAWGVAIQGDGKIVVAGEGAVNFYRTGSDFAVARLNTDGTLDTTFSGDGMQTTNIRDVRWDRASGVAIQSDGKIVAVGSSYADYAASDPRLVAVRYNTDGSLDSTFSGDGKVKTYLGQYGGYAQAVATYSDGKILVAGRSFVDSLQDSSDFVVVRYSSDGTLDPTFGGGGIVKTSFGSGADVVNALAVQTDGKIVAAGEVYGVFGLARYLGDA